GAEGEAFDCVVAGLPDAVPVPVPGFELGVTRALGRLRALGACPVTVVLAVDGGLGVDAGLGFWLDGCFGCWGDAGFGCWVDAGSGPVGPVVSGCWRTVVVEPEPACLPAAPPGVCPLL